MIVRVNVISVIDACVAIVFCGCATTVFFIFGLLINSGATLIARICIDGKTSRTVTRKQRIAKRIAA